MKVRDSDVLAWVRGQRKMSEVLGAFGLPYVTMFRPVLASHAFSNLWIIHLFKFPIFFGHSKPRILNQWIRGHDYVYQVTLYWIDKPRLISVPYLHHQSIPDYKFTYASSTKWQYRTRINKQYSSEYPQVSSTSTLFMEKSGRQVKWFKAFSSSRPFFIK
jgi:hypothetical protein